MKGLSCNSNIISTPQVDPKSEHACCACAMGVQPRSFGTHEHEHRPIGIARAHLQRISSL